MPIETIYFSPSIIEKCSVCKKQNKKNSAVWLAECLQKILMSTDYNSHKFLNTSLVMMAKTEKHGQDTKRKDNTHTHTHTHTRTHKNNQPQ